MSAKLFHAAVLTSMLALGLPAAARAQAKTQGSGSSASATAKEKEPAAPAKLSLQDITLVSTSQAAREAAKESKNKASEKAASKSGPSTNDGVVEFQPAAAGTSGDSKTIQTKNNRKSPLKSVHGSIYGSTGAQGAQGRATAGDVGVGSRNGKFNIFVQGQDSRADNPAPH